MLIKKLCFDREKKRRKFYIDYREKKIVKQDKREKNGWENKI